MNEPCNESGFESVECTISVQETFINWISGSQHGEVVLVVPRPQNKILLHTKSFYPKGVFRLPTGKMKAGEAAIDAFYREFLEELGCSGAIDRKLGVVQHRFVSGSKAAAFDSHVFLSQELAEQPIPRDKDEQITGFADVTVSDLLSVAAELRALTHEWRDWGAFRASVHEFVANRLRGNNAP